MYGECGKLSCSESDTSYRTLISRTYKFYLVFENSLCSEYITEKLWRPMQQTVVPIVLGGADYEKYLTKHSYINVKDFKSPYELAKYLKVLDKNDTLYNEYFDWKKSYSCYRGVPGKSIACNMCRLRTITLTERRRYQPFQNFGKETLHIAVTILQRYRTYFYIMQAQCNKAHVDISNISEIN